jgi:hypothetical protein
MAKELDLQAKIIKSVKQDGGYGRKISHKFAIGIPDLLLALPSFVPCMSEVKDLGVVVDNFDRQIGVTDKQLLEMKRFSEPYENSMTIYTPSKRAALILVGIVHRGEHRLVALPRDAERLDAGYEADPQRWRKRQTGGYYEIKPLLEWAGIAHVRPM